MIWWSESRKGKGSLPVRGAWIEIVLFYACIPHVRSLPVRGAWIEITKEERKAYTLASLPVRGAWIEMSWI